MASQSANAAMDRGNLEALVKQKEIDHLVWISKVNELLTDDHVTKLNVQTDDHQCSFGKWLYGEGRKKAEHILPELTPLLKSIEGLIIGYIKQL